MKLDNVERVELFNFPIDRIDILKTINTTKLKNLLIAPKKYHKNEGFWHQLDKALAALQVRMGSSRNLNFYLISNEFELEERALEVLGKCMGEGVIVNRSIVEESMKWMGSRLHGSGERCKYKYSNIERD